MVRVAYIGNFAHEHCTEVAVAYGLEQCGATVQRIQQEDAHDRYLAIERTEPDLVLYTRTHNRTALGPVWTDEWERFAKREIVTASLHLDRFWDLDRERLIHDRDPLFTTQHVFTADGGNQTRFEAAGVNHHWLPPAVHAPDCYDVQTYETVPPVVFVGSGGGTYHSEYPQRGELLAFLEQRYGRRFARYGVGTGRPAVRGEALNAVIQSAQVVVGDSCFANDNEDYVRKPWGVPSSDPSAHHFRLSDSYWSDRIPETLGRGGALVHPHVEGLTDHYLPGVHLMTHPARHYKSLGEQIDWLLDNDDARKGMARMGRARVLNGHTYTHRAAELLHACGLRDTADIEIPA